MIFYTDNKHAIILERFFNITKYFQKSTRLKKPPLQNTGKRVIMNPLLYKINSQNTTFSNYI